jgi:hypothetical protein
MAPIGPPSIVRSSPMWTFSFAFVKRTSLNEPNFLGGQPAPEPHYSRPVAGIRDGPDPVDRQLSQGGACSAGIPADGAHPPQAHQ